MGIHIEFSSDSRKVGGVRFRSEPLRTQKEMASNVIICGDCLEFLRGYPTNGVDLILTDPPFNIEVNKRGCGTGFYKTKDHLTNIDESFGTSFDPMIYLTEMLRVSLNGIVQWISQSLVLKILNYAERNHYKWDLLFWHKSNSCPNHYNHLMIDTEYGIRIYRKGAFFNNDLEYDYYHKYYIDTVQHLDGHPTPKPLALMEKQVLLYSRPGDLILDPFAGSGTTCMAAKKYGRRYIGIDINPAYCKLAEERIASIEKI